MKLYRSTIALLMALLFGGCLVGCNEEATLEGADEVYITLNPTDITLRMGDTVRVSATAENLSGATIETPIKWSIIADAAVIEFLGDSLVVGDSILVGDSLAPVDPYMTKVPVGDTFEGNDVVIVCLPGSQGKNARLKAELVDGRYGLANVSVTTHFPDGVCAVDTAGNVITSYRSYFSAHDSVIFAVTPKELLEDYVPTYTVEGVTALDNALSIDKKNGRFAVHFTSPRESGTGKVSVAIGNKGSEVKASCDILLQPEVFATFYGEKYAGMPYIDGGHPDKSTLPMYFAYLNETNMDLNSEATVRVAINVQTGAEEDIKAAYGSYRWEIESGSSVIISEMRNEYFPEQGFDAVLSVRSGIEEGLTTFRCITPDTVLTATFNVLDYTNRYPVEEITVDKNPLEMKAGEEYRLQTGVVPMTSYGIHKPVVTVADPSIASVGVYDGNLIPIKALAVGSTELILTANGKELRVPLTVTEDILSVGFIEGNSTALFEGQSVEWGLKVNTYTGGVNPYPVVWASSDETKVKAVAAEGDNGTITAVAEGTANITATVDDVTSPATAVKVVAATDRTFGGTNVDAGASGIYFNGDDLELYLTTSSGSIVVVNAVGVGAKTDCAGTYSDNLMVTIDDAKAAATGSVVVTNGTAGYTVGFNLTISVGTKTFKVEATNMSIASWM